MSSCNGAVSRDVWARVDGNLFMHHMAGWGRVSRGKLCLPSQNIMHENKMCGRLLWEVGYRMLWRAQEMHLYLRVFFLWCLS